MSNENKITIAKDGVKRTLTLPLEICLSKDTARHIRDALKQADHDEFAYGWIKIAVEPPDQGQANTPPLDWNEAAKR